MSGKIHNFGAGPAKIPDQVYEVIRDELTNFGGSGISLMETSHRVAGYLDFNKHVQKVVRDLLSVPDNYRVLFLPGGGQGQFAAVPLNLISRTGVTRCSYPHDECTGGTGAWSKKAAAEAKKYGDVKLVLPPQEKFRDIPDQSKWTLNPKASYVHICANETIHGVEFDFTPDTHGVPLVADMSSNIMSRKVDVSKYAVIYAGAQKNIGTSGVALVIVREDLLGGALPICPSVLDWTLTNKNDSVLNTPPMFPIYVMGRVLEWIVQQGGVEEMCARATRKAAALYGEIEESGGFYSAPVAPRARSRMNVPFRIGGTAPGEGDAALEAEFLRGAESLNLIQLKGHRDAGGLRASLYNAVTQEEVALLVRYMREFRQRHAPTATA